MNKVIYPPELESDKLPAGCLPDLLWPAEIGVELPHEVNLTEWFLDRNLAGEKAERVAFYSGERAVTYRVLNQWVNKFANALRGLGVDKGDRVMLRIANSRRVCGQRLGGWAALRRRRAHDDPSTGESPHP